MPVTYTFRDGIDKPKWVPRSSCPNAGGVGAGIAGDLRNDLSRDPHLWEFDSAAILNAWNIFNDGWTPAGMINPAMGGTFGAGSNIVLMPHRGPRGTITAATSASSFTLSTLELSASVNANALAANGGGTGYKIRVYDPVAGLTGEGIIISNTAGTTPIVVLSTALAFTPSTSASYEILSGRVYLYNAGTVGAGVWKYYDIALNLMSGNLSTTNLVTPSTDSALLCMDEQYVPCNLLPGQGYFGNIASTGAAAGTITGAATNFDSALQANEFRNFQIRIISDGTNKTSVGQRRRITSHTAGPSVVYTLNSNWTVTPSTGAVFVIENNNDILLWTGASTSTFAYHEDAQPMNVTAQTWDTTTYAARTVLVGAGTMAFMPHGVSNAIVASSNYSTAALYGVNDPAHSFRYSQIHSFRGGAAAGSTLDIFDIAGAATGAWTAAAPYGNQASSAFGSGTAGAYDGVFNNGKNYYINYNGGQYFLRYDAFTRNLDNWCDSRYPRGTAVVGAKMECMLLNYDSTGPSKSSALYTRPITAASTGASTELFESLVSR
jgi:hypothetical protein